jgi:hypothetical protein
VDARIQQVREGDRVAAANLMAEYGGLIRRRLRQKMGRALRRLLDSQDLLSTISRRVDAMVQRKAVTASTEQQWLALVLRVGQHALADKGRIESHLRRVEGPDSEFAQRWRSRLAKAERRQEDGFEIELDTMLRMLDDPREREILTMWLMGRQLVSIAEELGETPACTWKKWERIRQRLSTCPEFQER